MTDTTKIQVFITDAQGRQGYKVYSPEEYKQKNVAAWLDENYPHQYQVRTVEDIEDGSEIDEGAGYNVRVEKADGSYAEKEYSGSELAEKMSEFQKRFGDGKHKITTSKVQTYNTAKGPFAAEERARLLTEMAAVKEKIAAVDKIDMSGEIYNTGLTFKTSREIDPGKDVVALRKQLEDLQSEYYNLEPVQDEFKRGAEEAREANERLAKLWREESGEINMAGEIYNPTPSISHGAEYDYNKTLSDAARRLNNETRKLYEAPSKYDGDPAIKKFFIGAGDRLTDADFWTMGLTEAADYFGLNQVFDKIQKLGGLENLTEEDIESNLTPFESEALGAFFRNMSAQAAREEDLALAYQSGMTAADSIGFMAQFALSGGATAAASKAMGNWIAKKIGKEVIEKAAKKKILNLAGKAVKGAVETGVQTLLQPHTYANYQRNKYSLEAVSGNPEDGIRLVKNANEALRSYADSYIETLSEKSGTALGWPARWVGKKIGATAWMDALKRTKFGRVANAFFRSDVLNFMKAGGWNGYLGEMGEEFFGDALRTITQVDPEALKNAVQRDNLLIMATSFLPMTMLGGIGGIANYAAVRKEYDLDKAYFQETMRKFNIDESAIQHAIDVAESTHTETPEQLNAVLSPLVDEVVERGGNPTAVFLFARKAAQFQFYRAGDEVRKQMDRETELARLEAEYGGKMVDSEGNVKVAALPDGGTGIVVTSEGGESMVKKADGTIGFVSNTEEDIESIPLNDFLDRSIYARVKAEDDARVEQESAEKVAEAKQKVVPGAAFNNGTEESPMAAEVIEVVGDTANVQMADGSVKPMHISEVAQKMGTDMVVKTREEMEAEKAEALVRGRQIVDQFNSQKMRPVVLNTESGPVEATGIIARVDENGKVFAQVEVQGEEMEVPYGQITLVEAPSVAPQTQTESETVETPAAAAPQTAAAPTGPVDFRGNPLPMRQNKNGEMVVDEGALWNNDPEAFAAYNDANPQRAVDTMTFLTAKLAELGKKKTEVEAALQNEYITTMNGDKIDAYKDDLSNINDRIAKVSGVIDKYNKAAEMALAQAEAKAQAEAEAAAAPKSAAAPAAETAENAAPEASVQASESELRAKVEELQKKLGVPIKVFTNVDSVDNAAAKAALKEKRKVTGWYDVKSGGVGLYLPNIKDANEITATYVHEVVAHKGVREALGKKGFENFLSEVWKGMSLKDQTEFLSYPGVKDWKDAADEYVAHHSEALDFEPSVWSRIAGALKTALSFIGIDLTTTDDVVADALRQSYRNLKRGAKETQKENAKAKGKDAKFRVAAEQLKEMGVNVDEKTGDVRFSVRYVTTDEQKDKLTSLAKVTTGRNAEDVKRWIDSEQSVAALVLADQQYLDYDADSRYTAIKTNSDYPQGTVDFNNLCRKRLPFTEMYTRLQREWPNKVFNKYDLAVIRDVMSKDDLLVACGLCYVEDRRQLIGEVAEEFIGYLQNGFDAYINKTGNADAKRKNVEKFQQILAGDTYIPNIYELATLEGGNQLYESHPSVWKAFQAFNNARGQQSQNLFQGYAEYKREILSWTDAHVKKVNDNGGLRIFSYSDFEAHHLIDTIQIIMDCAARGVMVQGYTKVPAFARAVANTGIKLNRSLIPLGDTGIVDGQLAFDPVEGIDVNDPNFLEANDNVGNVLVGINDEQIRLAMADPRVHYIIPFHGKRKAGELRAKLNIGAWQLYDDYQIEKDAATGRAAKNGINIYTDILKGDITNDQQFVEAYLNLCKQRGITPKFPQFLNVDAQGEYVYTPGYYKFLVDFKLFDESGNILPQQPVVAEFDDNFNAQILNEYVEGEKESKGEAMDETFKKIVKELGLEEETTAEGEGTRFKIADDIRNTKNIEISSDILNDEMRKAYEAYSTKQKGYRNIVADWAISILPNEVDSSIGKVKISRGKIKDAISHGYGPLKFFSIPYLEAFIKNGVYYSSNKKNNLTFHNLAHRFAFDGENYVARISIQEDQNGELFYDHEFTELKKIDAPATGREGSNATTSPHQPSLNDLIRVMNESSDSKDSDNIDTSKKIGSNTHFRESRTDEQREKLFADAKAEFGTTNNFKVAGYMLPDGSLLDFSEANNGGNPNQRSLDHREIESLIMNEGTEYESRWMYLADFMNEGAIRLLPEYAGINLMKAPTKEQRQRLMDFIYKYNGEVILEIADERLNNIAYVEYDRRTSPARIMRDIDGYFNEGIVPRQTSDIRFSIIGERGAMNDKTEEGLARFANLDVARQMESKLNPDWSAKEDDNALKIKVATGWERGADGKWRYEVDDVKIKPAKDWLLSKKKLTLRDVVEPNPVFDLYPELLDVTIVKDKSKYNLGAWYDESTKQMKLPVGALKEDYTAMMDYYGEEQKDGNFARYWKIMEEDFLHEIQHAIQHREGFANGGNPDMLLPEDWKAYEKLYDEMSDLVDTYNAIPERERNMAYAVSARNQALRAKDDAVSFLRRHKIGEERYKRLAGEVESRNVVNRSKLSDYERYNSLLASTEDVARKDQIFLMDAVDSAESSIRFRMAFSSANEELNKNGISLDNQSLMDKYGLSAIELSKRGNYVTLSKIVAAQQGQGNGTRFMEDLARNADENGWILALTPDTSYGASSVSRLKNFYKRFGFKENKGRNTDFNTKESMVRTPSGETMFRERREDESAMEFYQTIVDEHRSRYNTIVPTEVFPINAATAKRFGYTLKELQKTSALYSSSEKLIAIFADEDEANSAEVEESIFHESIHALVDISNDLKAVGIWMWNAANKSTLYSDFKKMIEQEYSVEEYAEEMMCHLLSGAMTRGLVDILYHDMPERIRIKSEQIFNEIGYDRAKESISRNGQDNAAAVVSEVASEEGKEDGGRGFSEKESGREEKTSFRIGDNAATEALNAKQLKNGSQEVVEESEILFRISNNNRQTITGWLNKREDLTEEDKQSFLDYIEDFPAKNQLVYSKWFANGAIRLPEDAPKVEQAIKVAAIAKVDPMRYRNPMEIIDAFADIEVKGKRINPDTVSTLSDKQVIGDTGIVTYLVEESEESRKNMREIINTHFGKDCSPWCLLQGDGNGNLTEQSAKYWKHYSAYPKRVAFKNGKLLAFSANSGNSVLWWDKQDASHDGIPVIGKLSNDELGRSGVLEYSNTGEILSTNNIHRGDKKDGVYEEWSSLDGPMMLHEDRKDGNLNGLRETWYDNGQKKDSASFKDGEREWTRTWHKNGQLKSSADYVDGKMEGTLTEWNEEGVMIRRSEFKNGRLHGLHETFHSDGQVDEREWYTYGERDGKSETYYPNGQLRTRRFYDKGEQIGLSEGWYEDGQLTMRESYSHGQLDGQSLTWYTNGQLMSKQEYDKGTIVGISEAWHKNGQLLSRSEYANGLINGIRREWDRNGQLVEEAEFKDGLYDGVVQRWDDEGHLESRQEFKDNSFDGVSEEFYPSGQMKSRINYKQNNYDGLYEEWYENGQTKKQANYKNNSLDGWYAEWYENGQMKISADYARNELDGLYEEWYENGQMKNRATYKDGNTNGLLTKWNEQGKVTFEAVYDNGLKVQDEALFREVEITPEVRQEMNRIGAVALVNGTYLKAPNGKDTNLTDDQWALVRTENFKKWFGDWENDPENASKVVDENGEPKVVYHGTPHEFWEFRYNHIGSSNELGGGYYFGTKDLAEIYARPNEDHRELVDALIDRYFSEHPEKSAGESEDFVEAEQWAEQEAFKNARLMPVFLNIRKPYVAVNEDDFSKRFRGYDTVGQALWYEGYDGVIDESFYKRHQYDFKDSEISENTVQYFLTNPANIKSATDNNGEFRLEDMWQSNDIRFRSREEAKQLLQQMQDNAELLVPMQLTEELWKNEIEGKIFSTPVGDVKLGPNQYDKNINKGREREFGMLLPTIERPDLIFEESDPEEGAERQTAYVFVKTFYDENGERHINYASVSVQKEGMEVVKSSHRLRDGQVLNKIEKEQMLWNRFASDSSSSAPGSSTDQSNALSESKDSDNLDNINTSEETTYYREVTDPETLERLNSEPTIKVYRAMQLIDGKLYPPMSAREKVETTTKSGKVVNRWKLRTPIELGKWEEAEERPDMAREDGTFILDKGNGSTVPAAYNPYFHTSRTPLNDQFSSAQSRPNLVTVEVEVPESELTSDYKAEKAKDSVGEKEWKAGVVQGKLSGTRKVILTRWNKPVRIVPDSEVADEIVKMFEGKDIVMPSNVVTPSLRAELEERGVPFIETDNNGNPVTLFRDGGVLSAYNAADFRRSERAKKEMAQSAAELMGMNAEFITRDDLAVNLGLIKGYAQGDTMYIAADNCNDSDDAVSVVLSEAAKSGLERVLGDRYTTFLKSAYAAIPDEKKMGVAESAVGQGLNLPKAVEEYIAEVAGDSSRDEEFEMLSGLLREGLVARGIETVPADNVLRWMLWNAPEQNRQDDLMGVVKSASAAHRFGVSTAAQQARGEVEDLVRFREIRDHISAADIYNSAVTTWVNRVREVDSDMYQSVNVLMDAIEKATGRKAEGFEDIRTALVQQSSKGLRMSQDWEKKYFKPLRKVVEDICNEYGVSIADVERYVMTKHGLERNEVFAKRDAKEFHQAVYNKTVASIADDKTLTDDQKDALKEKAKKKLDAALERVENETDAKYKELRKNDYGGLVGLYSEYTATVTRGEAETQESYNKRLLAARKPRFVTADGKPDVEETEKEAYLDAQEFQNKIGGFGDGSLARTLWDRINAANKATLKIQQDAGLISRAQYESISKMFEYYVPLRGFSDTTAEDMYDYYTASFSGDYTQPLKRASGRTTVAESPFGYIGAMASSAIASAEKNRAKLALYYFIQNRPDQDLAQVTDTWYEADVEREADGSVKKDANGTPIYKRDADGKKIFRPAFPDPADLRGKTAEEIKQVFEDFEKQMRQKQMWSLAFKRTGKQKIDYVIHANKSQLDEHIISVKVLGQDKKIYINGNPRAAQAINQVFNLDANAGKVSQGFLKVLRYMSAVNTSYNPEFAIGNFERDLVYALMSISVKEDKKYNERFVANIAKAFNVFSLKLKDNKDNLGSSHIEDLYREFVEQGGITGYTVIKGNEEWEKQMNKFSVDEKKIVKYFKQGLEGLQYLGESLEQVTRFAVFMTSREMGRDIRTSIANAKDVTVNFNRKGSGTGLTWEETEKLTTKDGKPLSHLGRMAVYAYSHTSGFARRSLMFYNAAMQALSATVNLYRKNPLKMGVISAAFLFSGAIKAAWSTIMDALVPKPEGDDDEYGYEDISEYERRNNFMVRIGDGVFLKWSLPQEQRVFYAIGDLIVNQALGKEPHKNFAEEFFKIILDVLPINPAGGVSSFIPSILTPIYEAGLPLGLDKATGIEATNKDFTGAPIYKDFKYLSEDEQKMMPNYQRAYAGTAPVYIWLAETLNNLSGGDQVKAGWINMNPAKWQHLVEGYTGGVGKFATNVINTIHAVLDKEESVKLKQVPFLNRVVTDLDDRSRNSRISNLFYYYKNEAELAETIVRKYLKAGEIEKVQKEMETDQYKWLQIYQQYEGYEKMYQQLLKDTTDEAERKRLMKEQDAYREEMIEEIAKLR